MISITGNPFTSIVDYLDAVLKNADQVYEEAALEAGQAVENTLNAQAELFGAPASFKTYHEPGQGMVTGPVSGHQEIFDVEFGTPRKSPIGFVRGTFARENGENFSNILTNKLYQVKPNVSSG